QAAHQSALVSGCAWGAVGVAGRGRAAGRGARGRRGRTGAGRRGGAARRPRRWSALGRADAPDVCVRRPRVRTVRPSTKLRPPRAKSRGGGRLQLIALIGQAAVITRILRHLGLPSEVPASCPSRSPPTSALSDADAWTW